MKLLIIFNAVLLVIGFLNLEYALWIYELLKPFKMISLETAFDFHVLYHNSIFFCIMGLPSIIASSRNKYSQILICFTSFLLIFKKSVIISIIAWLIFIIPSVVSRVIIILFIGLAAIYLVDMETLDGNRIRLGYLIRYLEIFSDPKILLFGEGLSISDWGNGFQANLIELTYFELIRYVGIPVSALFMVSMVWTTLHAISISKYRLQGLGVMMFLISCAFNPYLWGILGLPLIAIMIPVGDRVS
jgi:hypothetical protein